MTDGLFLSFEGGEASGKSEQARRLAEALREAGHVVVLTREPGGTAAGDKVREIVLHARDIALTPRAQALLFSTARAQLVHEVIAPALARGAVVIADRFYDSTFVYQGSAGDVPREDLEAMTRAAVGDVRPHRTFVLDVPVDVASDRRANSARRWDRFEMGEREFHERLREGYLDLARREPGRIVVVDGARPRDAVAQDIRRHVDALLAAPVRG